MMHADAPFQHAQCLHHMRQRLFFICECLEGIIIDPLHNLFLSLGCHVLFRKREGMRLALPLREGEDNRRVKVFLNKKLNDLLNLRPLGVVSSKRTLLFAVHLSYSGLFECDSSSRPSSHCVVQGCQSRPEVRLLELALCIHH